ncbi:terpenoid synthase [Penicillium brevicompactum]
MATFTGATAHASLRQSILGQKVTIPSIYKTFPDWKPRLHEYHERARDEVLDPWIEKWVIDKRTMKALKTADFGVFAAVWCPDAPFDVLCTAAKYFAWYFVYDDIFDCGTLKHDEILASGYRAASLQYFRFSLLGEGLAPDLSCFDIDLQYGLECWNEIGEHICQVSSRSTREVLCDEMMRYVGSLNNVDSIFSAHGTPTIEQYWERREATAAAHCVIATLPTNDMLSFRKEVNDDQIENLIPVLMLNREIDCNTAMSRAYQLLQNEADGFHEAEAQLDRKSQGKSKVISDLFREGCLNVAMGLTHWSYLGDRYFKVWERDEHDVIQFTVESPKSKINASMKVETPKKEFDQILLSQSFLQYAISAAVQYSPFIMMTVAVMVPRLNIFFPRQKA